MVGLQRGVRRIRAACVGAREEHEREQLQRSGEEWGCDIDMRDETRRDELSSKKAMTALNLGQGSGSWAGRNGGHGPAKRELFRASEQEQGRE